MCKIIFQILLSMSVSFQLIAQSRPIKSLGIGNQWNYVQNGRTHVSGSHTSSFKYQVIKDTLIDNELFCQLNKIQGDFYGNSGIYSWSRYYERADSVRLEAIVGAYDLNDRELIYDFSMNVGDTLVNPIQNPRTGPRMMTTIVKGDTVFGGENLRYLKIRSISNLYGWCGYSTIVAVEKFGVTWIKFYGIEESYTRKLKGAVINNIVYGDTTNTFSWIKLAYPSKNSSNSEWSPIISISFSEPIDPATLNDNTILVYANHSGAQSINTINYNASTQILEFTLSSPLMPGEDVTVTLKNVRNLQGEWMSSFYAFHFKTRATNGTGIFTISEEINLAHTPSVLVSGDFDRDGELDLIAASSYSIKNRYGTSDWISISLLKNNAKKGFILTPPQDFLHLIQGLAGGCSISEFLLVDYDLTGDLGIILTTNYGALKIKQTELGSGLLKELETIETPYVILAGDINTDGFPDLITRTNSSEIRFYQNFEGNFSGLLAGIAAEDNSSRIVMGDWNNDSYLDMAISQTKSSKLLVYRNNGQVEFSLASAIENIDSAKCINVGNIDGDADMDLALSNGIVLLNNGQGKFSRGIPFNFNGDKIELGDIDGDGDLDLVGISKDSLIVFKNSGTGIFSMSSKLELEHRPNSLVVGD